VIPDELISRYLDGEASAEERLRVEGDAEAQAVLRKMRRLQALAELPETCAQFTAEDVLVRAGRTRPRGFWSSRWNWAAAAAAVFLLAVTHGAAFLYGARNAPQPLTASNPVDDTERILREMAAIDAAAPHDRLNRQLVDLRGELQDRVPLLQRADLPAALQERAETLVTIAAQVEIAFEQVDDVGFRAMAVRSLADQALAGHLRFALVPATANGIERVTKLDDGRFRVFVVRGGTRVNDEGTIEELEARHPGLAIRVNKESR